MKYLLSFLLLIFSIAIYSQVNYTGFIGKYPIELFTNADSDGETAGTYVYNSYDEPIALQGNLEKEKLILYEKDSKGNKRAVISFSNFDRNTDTIEGNWTDLKTNKTLKVSLTKNNDQTSGIIQNSATNEYYFKIITNYSSISQVNVFQKKTDTLIQKFDIDCQYIGMNSITLGDYNFDGLLDFSVFESSYAGPNTSSLYFLFNPNTKKFFKSTYSGVSLEFDQKRKRIIERNQCCAGTSVYVVEYKVIHNKMVLEKERCYKWNEKRQELVERKSSECN